MSVKLSKFRVDDTMIEIDVPDGSVTEEKLSPEVAEKLNSGGESGGMEFKTLDVTATFEPFVDTYTGRITSTIPEGIVINDIVKIEKITTDASMPDAVTLRPLPVYDLIARGTNFEIQYATWYQWIKGELPDEMREQYEQVYPLLILFMHQRGVSPEGGTFTMDFRITYV